MGGRGWWLGLAIDLDLDADAVVLSARHLFPASPFPLSIYSAVSIPWVRPWSFQPEPASYVGHRVPSLGGVQRI